MDSKEIEKLIGDEEKQLSAFLKIAEKAGLSKTQIEKQINFYLDKINELKKELKNNSK